MELSSIVNELKNGNFKYAYDNIGVIQTYVVRLLKATDEEIKREPNLLQQLIDLITIGNITYNYSDTDVLPIDDGIYDQLVVKLQRINYDKFTPGAIPVNISKTNDQYVAKIDSEDKMIKPFTIMPTGDREKLNDAFYPNILNYNKPVDPRVYTYKPIYMDNPDTYISKRIREVSHNYPNLVGTLEKCKFVLDSQAKELGVYDEANVKIFERDFMAPLFKRGLINMNDPIQMIGTLKYDGVSIEADVTDRIIAARTRGDTDYNVASDVTPIFDGYTFPNATELQLEKPIGMKFEAIILHNDLQMMNEMFGTNYINGRTAIIGILGSSDGWKYRNYITLVPLQVDFGDSNLQFDRYTEIQFLNKYYATREYLRYEEFNAQYHSLMFQIKKYVEEAEYFRPWSMFMYDGVVLEFQYQYIRDALGRKNSINQYAMAIKFNPLKRITIFTGFTYTVGQNGVITPMIHYNPIEFMGAIHTKSTGSSYERFKNLNLFIGDEIYVTYVNDVMPYVTNVESEHNAMNHQRPIRIEETFPTHCPCCGTKLESSSYGKTMYCPNMNCYERKKQRLSNMLNKLDIKNFSEAAVEVLGNKSFVDMMNMSLDDLSILGPTDSVKLYHQLQDLKTNGIPDYKIIGALGFTNVAAKKWKIIFSKYTLLEIFHLYLATKGNMDHIVTHDGTEYNSLGDMIANIKGVGPVTALTIVSELPYFEQDINYIIQNIAYTVTSTEDRKPKYKVRFSGFRDPQLETLLNGFPFIDCDQNSSITKDTTILLVPNTAAPPTTKVNKAISYGVPVVDVKEFLEHPSRYIPEIGDVEI